MARSSALRIVVAIGIGIIDLGCGLLGGGGGSSGGESAPTDAASDEPVTVAAKSQDGGAVTATIDATSSRTLVLGGAAGTAVSDSRVSFPPKSLPGTIDVTMEPGVTLKTAGLEAELGVASSGATVREAGPALVVTADPPTVATSPFTISLVVDEGAGLTQSGGFLVVIYKKFDPTTGKYSIGLIPTSGLTRKGKLVSLLTRYFGAYQVMISDKEVGAVEVVTEKKIETVRNSGTTPQGPAPAPTPGAQPSPAPAPSPSPAPMVPPPDGDLPLLLSGASLYAPVAKDAPIRLIFNEEMRVNDIVFVPSSNPLGAGLPNAALAQTTVAGDTVVLTPVGTWMVGDDRAIDVTVKDKAGNAITVTVQRHIADRIYYVHSLNGSNANAGSAAAPFLTIAHAIDMANDQTTWTTAIHVADGTYPEYFTLTPGMRVYGGFSATDWNVYNPSARLTLVPGDGSNSYVARCLGTDVNPLAYAQIDGLKIEMPQINPYPIDSNGAGPECRVVNNHIKMNATSVAIGVRINGQNSVIVDNLIESTLQITAGPPLWGIYVSGADYTEIARNVIKLAGNSVNYSHGIDATVNISAVVFSNSIHIAGANSTTYGLRLASASNAAYNNTISLDGTGNLSGVDNAVGPLDARNNLIVVSGSSSMRCVDSYDGGYLTGFYNNAFKGCTSGTPTADGLSILGGSDVDTIGDMESTLTSGTIPHGGNVFGNPTFVNGTLKPTALYDAKNSGLNLSTEMAWTSPMTGKSDLDHTPRTVPWSIGAYEID